MEIRSETVYDQATVTSLIKYSSSFGHPTFVLTIVLIANAIFLACTPLLIISGSIAFTVIEIFFLILFDGVFIFGKVVTPRLCYRQLSKNGTMRVSFVFRNENFSVAAQNELSREESTSSYAVLRKVVETPDCLFLFISRKRAMIVAKNSLSDLDLGMLTSHLKSFGFRYIMYK